MDNISNKEIWIFESFLFGNRYSYRREHNETQRAQKISLRTQRYSATTAIYKIYSSRRGRNESQRAQLFLCEHCGSQLTLRYIKYIRLAKSAMKRKERNYSSPNACGSPLAQRYIKRNFYCSERNKTQRAQIFLSEN